MTLPSFLVIGASRSGTTSLHHYLGQHPDVYMSPVKSPNYFVSADPLPAWEGAVPRAMARQWISERSRYEALFAGAGGRRAIGEVSPVYLQSVHAPARILDACPDARLVAILRHPVDRAWAHYLGRRRDGLEPRDDFRAVVEAEMARPLPDQVAFGSYLGCSRYHHFLAGYFARFPRERIRVYLFDELLADAGALVADLFAFVGVEARIAVDTERRHNQTGVARSPLRRLLWTRTVRARTALRPLLPARVRDVGRMVLGELERPALDPELRARIARVLAPDLERLEALLDRDLARWRCDG
jgi:Sulfotransferase family